MSIRERPKKESKKEDTSSIDDWLDDAKPITKNNQEKIEEETSTEVVMKENLLQKFNQSLPKWVNKPWMYVQPTHPNHLGSWKESWKNLLLEYSRHFNYHIINLTELIDIYPFDNNAINKKLTKPQIDVIVQELVTEGLAKWLDDNYILVRVYYKTLDQWKDIMVKFLFDGGYVAEILTVYEIQNMDQEWCTLPRDDLITILQMVVDENRAKWIGKDKDSIKFEI